MLVLESANDPEPRNIAPSLTLALLPALTTGSTSCVVTMAGGVPLTCTCVVPAPEPGVTATEPTDEPTLFRVIVLPVPPPLSVRVCTGTVRVDTVT